MKIIDNCLGEEYFEQLVNTFCGGNHNSGGIPWWYGAIIPDNLNHANTDDPNQYFFTHLIYKDQIPKSEQYNVILPWCKVIREVINNGDKEWEGKREYREDNDWNPLLLRVRANLFPGTTTLHTYDMHTDYPFSHTAAILSLNTCDGYTKLVDGTKIDSVANRMVLFDAGKEHAATNTTNTNARFNLIANFL